MSLREVDIMGRFVDIIFGVFKHEIPSSDRGVFSD